MRVLNTRILPLESEENGFYIRNRTDSTIQAGSGERNAPDQSITLEYRNMKKRWKNKEDAYEKYFFYHQQAAEQYQENKRAGLMNEIDIYRANKRRTKVELFLF